MLTVTPLMKYIYQRVKESLIRTNYLNVIAN